MLIAGASLIAAACLAAGCGEDAERAAEASTGVDTSALQADMDTLVDLGVPGIIVRVNEGDASTTLTSGVSDLEAGTPVAAADQFRIGSLAKPYVAAVVMQLVDEGKLSLEDTVEKWLPGAVPAGDQITLRQLLQHQSGIADYGVDPNVLKPYLEGDYAHVWTPEQLVESANAQGPTSKPGTDVSYSNTNYALVGLIVEKASGNSLGDELQTRIFDPLELTETSFATDGKLEEPYARGYLVGEGEPIDATEVYPYYWGAGNIVADADDVAHFYDALLGGDVVSPESLDEMKDTIPENPDVSQGLGLVSGELGCGAYVGHDGSVPGYFSAAYTFDDGRQVVFLANSVAIDDTVAGPKAQKALADVVETACA
jgi:D-alanyl-D-alanine carboxypeptidase